MTIPGISRLTAATLMAAIGDFRRFPSKGYGRWPPALAGLVAAVGWPRVAGTDGGSVAGERDLSKSSHRVFDGA